MSRNTKGGNAAEFGRARDELFSHIHRCGVLKATAEQQAEWMEDTMEFMAERYPQLSQDELGELRAIGLRFCQPVTVAAPAEETAETDASREGGDAEAAAA